jgi:ABC-type Fe3+/spermidine/putrescine transport system ATPase subunit
MQELDHAPASHEAEERTRRAGPRHAPRHSRPAADGDEAILVMRSSAIRRKSSASPHSVPGEVRKATYLGSRWGNSIAAEITTLVVTRPDAAPGAPGDTVNLTLTPERLALVRP